MVHIHDPLSSAQFNFCYLPLLLVCHYFTPSININYKPFLAVAVQSHFFFSIVQCNLYYTTVITLMTVRNICRRNRQKIISVWTSHIICIFAFIYGMYDRTSKVYLSRHLVLEEFDDELVSLSIGLSSRTTRELQ